jgi:hypothetical protein
MLDTGVQGPTAQRSQIGIAECCVPQKVGSTVETGSFPFRYQTGGSGMPGGRTQEASDVPAEIARPFAELRWMAPCRERPGRSGGGGTSGPLSRQVKREGPGVKRSQRCLSHRVSAGPTTARTGFRRGVLGEGFDSYVDIHLHQACRRRGRCACSLLWDWACWRRTCRGSNDDRVGPRRQVRERWQLEDQHR